METTKIQQSDVPFHLIETMTGKTIARASDPAHFKEVISDFVAHRYTIHHQEHGWFAPATSIFNLGKYK